MTHAGLDCVSVNVGNMMHWLWYIQIIHRPSKHQDFYEGLARDPTTFLLNETLITFALDEVDWTQEAIQELQDTINYGSMATACVSDFLVSLYW